MTPFMESLNEPQRQTVDRLRRTLFWSSYTNLMVRKDGENHWFEVDWLRDALDRLCGPHPEIERIKQEAIALNADAVMQEQALGAQRQKGAEGLS